MIINSQEELIDLLKTYMKDANYKQVDIANKLNIPSGNVNRIFKSKNKINIDTILKYINACDAKLDINIIPDNTDEQDKE
ncbi:MAG: helix-turn-helix domain-containing protein [Anaerostipes sp.]|uniref:helix-turn-helix domain-containing protein n=1 Tax=Anaerostipes sp. TaxID=1872530 RepID=UPI003993EB91